MAFKTTFFARQENFNKDEFIKAIDNISVARSITGVIYTNIRCDNNHITGIRESTHQSFTINLDSLYKAYSELEEFSTTALKPYVNRVQSPSLAILIAIGAVNEITLSDEEYVRRQVEKIPIIEKKTRMSGLAKFAIAFIIGGIIIFFGTLNNDRKPIENGQLTDAAHDYAVYCIKSKLDNPSSFEDGSWNATTWDSNSTDRRYVMKNQFTYKNSFGERVSGIAYVYFDVDGNATFYELQ